MSFEDQNDPFLYPPTLEDYLNGWQPIETAPKDGSTVLVYHVDFNVLMANWCPIGKMFMHDMTVEAGAIGLTHWMPLPDAPKTEDA